MKLKINTQHPDFNGTTIAINDLCVIDNGWGFDAWAQTENIDIAYFHKA